MTAKPSSNGSIAATLTVPDRPLRSTPYQVVATQTPPISPTPSPPPIFAAKQAALTASAFFFLPCPSVTLNPTCGAVGDSILVHIAGFRADLQVTISLTPPVPATPDLTVVPKGDSTFDAVLRVSNRPPGTYFVIAQQARTQYAARAEFDIPCNKGAIKLTPQVGPPGTVVTVTGTGFPVGAVVKLSWNQGVPLTLASITIDQSHGFQVTLLIFPHDELGKRTMGAAPDLSVASAPLFNIATADFLVVPGTAQPKKFAWRR